jgi:adenosylhomocysteine nucleosidase
MNAPPLPVASHDLPDPMRLTGALTATRPLLVLAVAEEAQFLDTDLPVLITGLGKVNAAAALAATLARGPHPSHLVNLGTAGALRPGWTGTHVIGRVFQHDLDSPSLLRQTGSPGGPVITVGDPAGPLLATGDAFIADERARAHLAAQAPLVDMEAYALAQIAHRRGIPIQIVKHVSDNADPTAPRTWRDTVTTCADHLATWARANIPDYR